MATTGIAQSKPGNRNFKRVLYFSITASYFSSVHLWCNRSFCCSRAHLSHHLAARNGQRPVESRLHVCTAGAAGKRYVSGGAVPGERQALKQECHYAVCQCLPARVRANTRGAVAPLLPFFLLAVQSIPHRAPLTGTVKLCGAVYR